jgi:hypothetical protein
VGDEASDGEEEERRERRGGSEEKEKRSGNVKLPELGPVLRHPRRTVPKDREALQELPKVFKSLSAIAQPFTPSRDTRLTPSPTSAKDAPAASLSSSSGANFDEESQRKPTQEWRYVTDSEIKSIFFDRKVSMSVRVDGIPNSLVVVLWDQIGARICCLCRACLHLGRHPRAWKEALALTLCKPHKPDYSLVNAYRPISLLCCLAKGLEKLVARRL